MEAKHDSAQTRGMDGNQPLAGYWEYTCSTPGSIWRWAKRIKRRVLVMSQDDAVYAQVHLGDKD